MTAADNDILIKNLKCVKFPNCLKTFLAEKGWCLKTKI